MSEVLMRIREVMAVTGLSRSSIYANPELTAKRVRITEGCVAWPKSSIDAWIAEKIAAGDPK